MRPSLRYCAYCYAFYLNRNVFPGAISYHDLARFLMEETAVNNATGYHHPSRALAMITPSFRYRSKRCRRVDGVPSSDPFHSLDHSLPRGAIVFVNDAAAYVDLSFSQARANNNVRGQPRLPPNNKKTLVHCIRASIRHGLS